MASIAHHAPGTFCWIELATTDQAAAKYFYSQLFGWSASDFAMGSDEVYTTFHLHSFDTAAAYTMRSQEKDAPPHWNLYIAVENADASAAKAATLGATVNVAPFDVNDFGRMAVLQDPTGAMFCIWQANQHIGTTIGSVPGTLCWADLSTPDTAKASSFYKAQFGWEFVTGEADKSGYLHIQHQGDFLGGVPPVGNRSHNMPPHWLPYFAVEDCDAIAVLAEVKGGKLILPPTTMEGVGRMSVITDPQGAVFAIFQATATQ